MNKRTWIFLLVALLASPSVFAQKIKEGEPDPIRVYVFSKPVTGFIDEVRPIEDSVTDIRNRLLETTSKNVKLFKSIDVPKFPNLVLVYSVEDSDITLEVVSSGKMKAAPETETSGTVSRGIFGTIITDSTSTVKEKIVPKLVTMLRVRDSDYSKEFSVQENTAWRYLANDIVDQLDKWVKANRPQLQQIKVRH